MGSTNAEWDNGPVNEMRIRSVNADEGVLGEFSESIAGNSVWLWRLDDARPLRPDRREVSSGHGPDADSDNSAGGTASGHKPSPSRRTNEWRSGP